MPAERAKNRSRRNDSNKPALRVLTAAASRIKIDDRAEVRRQRSVRQNWQLDAFTYRNSIGELRYAVNFLANCAARMRMYVAILPQGGESDMPIELTEYMKTHPNEVPDSIVGACASAISDLGNGRVAMSSMNHSLSTNISLAGEAFLLGQEDTQTFKQTWSVRSISEIVVMNDELKLREGPVDATGLLGLIDLDPDLTTVSRMWQPDPEWRLLADSPMRAIVNECEALLILRRNIRATGRSRLAGRGLLLFPDEVSLQVNNDDDQDPESDPVMNALADAMMTPIVNEGDASAVVPIVIRGPGEHLAQIRLVELSGTFDELAGKTRDELIGVIATGLDLPKEVILGIADLNHWSAWQVDDNTFRHHVEPHVIVLSDCWTSGYLRPYVSTASGVSQADANEFVPRLVIWYDPTELVTHPDRMQNANLLHDALAISDAAYRDVGGFGDEDAPSAEEIEVRMIRTMRNWPPNVVMALLHALDPTLVVPAMTGPPALPGIDPQKGATVPPPALASPSTPTPVGASESTSSVLPIVPDASKTPDSIEGPPAGLTAASIQAAIRDSIVTLAKENAFAALTASGEWHPSAESVRLSRTLQKIDSDLRARIQTIACAAMMRHLEKSGAKLRGKVASNETLRHQIADTHNMHVMTRLGRDVAERAGITAAGVTADTWSDFKDQYMQMTTQAQTQALKTAMQLAGLSEADADAYSFFANTGDAGWSVMQDSMNSIAVNLAYSVDPKISTEDAIAAFNPQTVVPTGVVRASLAVSGGTPEGDLGIIKTISGADVAAIPLGFPVGGVGTGATISGLLSANGAQIHSYEWEHGPSLKPFDPHLSLDGITFTSFTDQALANPGDFPNNQYFLPGDHIGCLCDVTPLWVSSQDVQNAMTNAGVDTSTWPASAFNTGPLLTTPKPTSVAKSFNAIPHAKTIADVSSKASQFVSQDVQDAMDAADVTTVDELNKLNKAAQDAGYDDFEDFKDSNGLTNYEAKNVEGAPKLTITPSGNEYSLTSMLSKQLKTASEVQRATITTDKQFASLDEYVGSNHKGMNSLLRFGKKSNYFTNDTHLMSLYKTHTQELKDAIDAQPRLDEEIIVVRRGYLPNDLTVGKTFTDKGFVSTSLKGGDYSYGRGTTMAIKFPKGTAGLDVNRAYVLHTQRNRISGEREFILPPGSKFKVLSINADGTYTLEHVPNMKGAP